MRYDLTLAGKVVWAFKKIVIFIVLAVPLGWFLFLMLLASYEITPQSEWWKVHLFLAFCSLGILVGYFDTCSSVFGVFKGARSVLIEDGLLVLPGCGQVEPDEIVGAKYCYNPFSPGLKIKVKQKGTGSKHTVTIFAHNYGADTRLLKQLIEYSDQEQPNRAVPADRDPRERGSRPLNANR